MMSSSSSVQKSFKYDVFLSFRGEDTRNNFVDHLYHALMDRGIYTYKDDETIQKGERISDDLFRSIEDSKIYIIVFSKNYASSPWCLEELVKIMKCHKMSGHTAYPVFYDVEPTEVRKQSGAVGEAFARHENQKAAGKWKGALKEVADLAGWELKNTLDGHKAKFIDRIVQHISLESKGMGGAGKTTTGRAVFDHLSNDDLEAKSFVGNAREVSNGSVSGLKNLGIMLMLMVFIYYFYSMASSFNSSAPEIMVSASTSSIQKRFKYDVFLSFRGEDTRKNFVDHLYHALKDKGVYTYKDDEKIQKGKRISDDLFKSIEDSKFYIIVFSKNYASSSWCLEELVKIMECQKMTEHAAYPVFYDVEPTEVRKQSGAVGEAFAKHEKEVRNQNWAVRIAFFMNKKKAMLKKWKGALKEAADLAGWELKNTLDGHEAKFINKIVQQISLELRSISSGFDAKLVGMETRVTDVISSLEIGIDEVRMIGIKGMGGAGKTTTARAVFDHLSIYFEAKSFVGNVREVSKASMFGLKNLQEQVLSNVLNEQVALNSVDDGKNMMKRRMCGIKVLLVLDDVDHIDQLKALAGDPEWFKPGTRILITTRDEQVLVAHRVSVIRDIVLLSEQEAISLFSRYAFGRENPLQGYEELSGKVVRYAAGLPLTVQVLGSFLCGKDKLEWVDAIERLKKIPLKETREKLELSYISLEEEYQEIFLDIACILKGQHKQKAIKILESCGFHARIGLKVLEQRSLITISKCGVLGMHDHIEEMGKNIVRQSHPDEPNKHSRLWINEEIEDILANDMGNEETRCLKFDMSRENLRIVMKGLGKMKKLRYLEVNYADYDSESDCKSDGQCLGSDPKLDDTTQYFPNSLNYLKFSYFPFLYLPRTFQANNLVGLEMDSSRMVQLWEEGEKKVLKKLRFLSLDITNLTTFDFRMTPNLEVLSMDCSAFRAGQAMGELGDHREL
ncbi:toll/interleukin-1 receptor (TIR) domain-containing protein [Artemisia annua]|uniref:Toll/interleukin-1 receptor (TIR) domain-containing protein n=1 Tax=Artemisia annua TaxID=35608 RepID=A0A2U1MPF9_ARTAN|nr:toll/interleukin-1 receptor (TIR) domain-containing protein [Artemisia annua]